MENIVSSHSFDDLHGLNGEPLHRRSGGGIPTHEPAPKSPDEHGGVMRGQLVREPREDDGKTEDQRRVGNFAREASLDYQNQHLGESTPKEGINSAVNNEMYQMAQAGSPAAAARVQDTDELTAKARGDEPGTEYVTNPTPGGFPIAKNSGRAHDNQ